MALVLRRVLPDEPVREHMSYGALVASTFALLVNSSSLRRQAWLGAVVFAAFNVMWTTLSFHLSAPPFSYPNGVIGLFGLFGVAGVVAANATGHVADKQRSGLAAVVAALLVTISFVILSLGRNNFWWLALGIIVLDFGVMGTQITSQSVIYALMPEARSRINSVYMVCCFVGASAGSYASGQLYAAYGWSGVCWLGVALGLGLVVPALVWRTPPASPALSGLV